MNLKYRAIRNLKDLHWTNFVFLTIAGTVNAFGVMMFMYPVKLYDSGMSGVSMLLNQLTPEIYTLSLFLVIFNVPIFIFGLKKQGFAFTVYSVFAVVIYSIVSGFLTEYFPLDEIPESPFAGNDLLLCAIFGGILSGIGSGMTIRAGGAIDGIDVLSVIFAKGLGLSLGSFVMIFDTILYIICGIIVGSWILPLYSIVTYYIGSQVVDFVVEGLDRSKCALIVTNKANEISDALSEQFHSSGTIVNAIGGYSKEEKQIIYFIINHFQINRLKKIVYEIDKTAFISMHDVSDIIRKQQIVHKK
ncbi:MAG: YitT family protein [Selenomonadaceae bacterium]|nr:YitT family protein [Selenomonadaceae bacterium]